LICRAREIAGGRRLIFKLHPNENARRATREIRKWAPEALVYPQGSAEEMIANCDVFITRYSSTVFVAIALEKEVHCDLDLRKLKQLAPLQNAMAAANIADVCRGLLFGESASSPPSRSSVRPSKKRSAIRVGSS
jgi:hypothetical protein